MTTGQVLVDTTYRGYRYIVGYVSPTDRRILVSIWYRGEFVKQNVYPVGTNPSIAEAWAKAEIDKILGYETRSYSFEYKGYVAEIIYELRPEGDTYIKARVFAGKEIVLDWFSLTPTTDRDYAVTQVKNTIDTKGLKEIRYVSKEETYLTYTHIGYIIEIRRWHLYLNGYEVKWQNFTTFTYVRPDETANTVEFPPELRGATDEEVISYINAFVEKDYNELLAVPFEEFTTSPEALKADIGTYSFVLKGMVRKTTKRVERYTIAVVTRPDGGVVTLDISGCGNDYVCARGIVTSWILKDGRLPEERVYVRGALDTTLGKYSIDLMGRWYAKTDKIEELTNAIVTRPDGSSFTADISKYKPEEWELAMKYVKGLILREVTEKTKVPPGEKWCETEGKAIPIVEWTEERCIAPITIKPWYQWFIASTKVEGAIIEGIPNWAVVAGVAGVGVGIGIIAYSLKR
ncbi:MAG: hypothetical protein AB1420_16025 [Bacillota bacterium]